jgi:dephospho-CoA kinase
VVELKDMKIIGLAGTNGSGKDTVAGLLKERHGYYIVSATDMLEAGLKKLNWPNNRTYKRKLGNRWRTDQGAGVIVKRAVEEAKVAGFDKVAIGSLRNPGEANYVHEHGGKIIWVDADPKIRYERISKRNRSEEDKKTYEQFIQEEQDEMNGSGDINGLDMQSVKDVSDVYLENNYLQQDELIAKLDRIVDLLA